MAQAPPQSGSIKWCKMRWRHVNGLKSSSLSSAQACKLLAQFKSDFTRSSQAFLDESMRLDNLHSPKIT